MPPEPSHPTRRELLHARLDALLDESDLVADNAAYGETFDDLENFFLIKGRKFLQETFQEQLQRRRMIPPSVILHCIGKIANVPKYAKGQMGVYRDSLSSGGVRQFR